MISTWGKPGVLDDLHAPLFKATLTPDAAAGQKVFGTYCASCHGDHGEGADVRGRARRSGLAGFGQRSVSAQHCYLRNESGDARTIMSTTTDRPPADRPECDIMSWPGWARTARPHTLGPTQPHPER